MTARRTSHAFALPRSRTAILVLDLITDLAFPAGRRLRTPALRAAKRIRALVDRADAAGIPVLYVNDVRGRWRSDAPRWIERCTREGALGKEIVETVRPSAEHCVVLKPKHSAFFGTPLDQLLEQIGATTLVLTGVSSHQCILFTATDAHVREYGLVIPRDCIAAPRASQTEFALRYFTSVLGAQTTLSRRIVLRRGPSRSRRTPT